VRLPPDRCCRGSSGFSRGREGGERGFKEPGVEEVVELLAAEALCTSHLVELTGAKQSNLSNHLKLLRDAGLTTTEPCGRFTYNLLVPDRLRSLSDGLSALADTVDAGVPRRACP